MNIDLRGKTALVTGSTAGIGFGIAQGLAATGARVLVNGRTQERVDQAIANVRAAVADAKIEGVAADVSNADGCNALIAALPDVDILVNNAGIFELKPFFDIPDQDWTRFFETNVMSGVRLSRAYMRAMLKRNWGHIIFISSESGINIPVEMIQYGFTKTAQLAVSRGLAELTAGTGVTVNAVLPGPTKSEAFAGYLKQLAAAQGVSEDEAGRNLVKHMRPTSLIQRVAGVEEVANMVVYVASKEASATNGAALRVDGGVVKTIV